MEPRQRRSRLEKVSLDSLRVPPAGKAQRPFRQSKGDQIAAQFDIDSFGFPVVCRVEGVNWLVDGQHRVYGFQKSGYAKSGDEIECEVYQGLEMAEMARIEGLGLVLAAYSRIDDKFLVRGLASEPHGLHGLQRRAEDYRERLGRQVPECVTAGVVDIYNRQVGGKRSLVKWWKAHKGGRLRRAKRVP